MVNVKEHWVELLATFFLAVGLLISLLTEAPRLAYVIILLSGFLGGRTLYVKKRTEPIFPFVFIILAFIFGYVIASFRVSRTMVLILFFGTALVSYYLHKKKIIGIFKSKDFYK